jgi:hypothetical protein
VHVTTHQCDRDVAELEQFGARSVWPQTVAKTLPDQHGAGLRRMLRQMRTHQGRRLGGRVRRCEVEPAREKGPLAEVDVRIPQARLQPAAVKVTAIEYVEISGLLGGFRRAQPADQAVRNKHVDDPAIQ